MKRSLEVIHPHAAGIDIGSQNFFVDAGEETIKVFSTYTQGCHMLRDYLKEQKITTVAMESTGVYWVVLYSILEDAGFDVYLVNGRDVKNVPGRKSDVKDCQWLRQLHSYGLLKKSFIPPDHIRELRSYIRLRQDHIRAQATQSHLMQKALIQMNIRLAETINDIMGVSGSRMIKAIIDGERDAYKLVNLCDKSILKKKKDLVLKALEGNYKEEHLFALRQAYDTWHYYQKLIFECDHKIEDILKKITHDKPEVEVQNKRKPIRYNRPDVKDLPQTLLKITGGKDPIGIAGITDYSFLQILSEVGADMSAWKTEKHFVSWLKLAPVRNSSGNASRRINQKRTNKASLIFRNVAQGLLTSKHVALGSFIKRIQAKKGSKVAVKAAARKIACYYYRVMTQGGEFVEKGIQYYEEQLKEKQRKYLEKMALKFNMQLIEM